MGRARACPPSAAEATARLVARDRFVEALAARPPAPFEARGKRRRMAAAAAAAAGGGGGGGGGGRGGRRRFRSGRRRRGGRLRASTEAARREAARAAQRAAEEEDEAAIAAEEEEERLERRAAKRAAESVRLQKDYERFIASEEGQAAAAYRAALPVIGLRDEVHVALNMAQVIVVCGETGSGKSTQVPQMILDRALADGRGGETNIIVTQPRRIAATSLARRVASERAEGGGARGALTGYQVRLESKRTEATRLLFCTTGIALRMMLSETPLDGISHVVVDEVHERDTQTDLLLLLLRELLPTRPNLRVVLMSATVQAETFTKYFGDCEVLNAKGRTFPVEEYHLEQALELTGHVLLPTRRAASRSTSSTIASSTPPRRRRGSRDDRRRPTAAPAPSSLMLRSSTRTTRKGGTRGSRRMCTSV